MILSDNDIKTAILNGSILIEPFDEKCIGSNSYDVHLSEHLAIYEDAVLDAKKVNGVVRIVIPESGFELKPGRLYLASTVEYTETHQHVPMIDGKSSIGRLGIDIHATAGKGDVGFCNHWTLEISVVHPVIVYPGMKIGQLIYYVVSSPVSQKYGDKASAKYTARDPRPQPSKMYLNF